MQYIKLSSENIDSGMKMSMAHIKPILASEGKKTVRHRRFYITYIAEWKPMQRHCYLVFHWCLVVYLSAFEMYDDFHINKTVAALAAKGRNARIWCPKR